MKIETKSELDRLVEDLAENLRGWYSEDPGEVETELGGNDQYSNGKLERSIKRTIEKYIE